MILNDDDKALFERFTATEEGKDQLARVLNTMGLTGHLLATWDIEDDPFHTIHQVSLGRVTHPGKLIFWILPEDDGEEEG